MGEIIVSILIGGCLIISGIGMNLALKREAKKLGKEDDQQ